MREKVEFGSLHSVGEKARNILRGIIGVSDPHKVRKALKKIESKYGRVEYKKALLVVRSNKLFENNGVARDFCICFPSIDSNVTDFSIDEIVNVINRNSDKICDLLRLFGLLLESIRLEDYARSAILVENIIDSYGVSIFLLRIFHYLEARLDGMDAPDHEKQRLHGIYKKFGASNIEYIVGSIIEISNPQSDYFGIRRRIRENSVKSPLVEIAKSFLDPFCEKKDDFVIRLNSYFAASLLDSFLCILVSSRFDVEPICHIDKVNPSIVSFGEEISSISSNTSPFLSLSSGPGISIKFFRECFLLIEQFDFFRYKVIHEALFSESEDKSNLLIPYVGSLVKGYFININSISDISGSGCDSVNIEKYNAGSANHLENSSALLYRLLRSDGDISGCEDKFVQLMSSTRDIGITCPSGILNKIQIDSKGDSLKLVAACLVSIKDGTQFSEHRLRKVIEDVAVRNYDSNVKNLIFDFHGISPSVTEHLVHICNETFLSKLFHLMPMPNKAIEDRADILEWYGKVTGDSAFVERARNLRIDVQINKEKGTIDDARIYVDNIKFTQWVSDEVISELSLSMPLVNKGAEIGAISIKWEAVKIGVTPLDQAASLLIKCYKEFCENKIFGIASYLGRRIRHGTLVGTGVNEVKDVIADPKYADVFSDKDISTAYQDWLDGYEEMLNDLVKSKLYVSDKLHPQGLFHSEPNSPRKKMLATQMFIEIHNRYIRSGGLIEAPYLIMEYCWRLIEEDLMEIRRFLGQRRSQNGVFSVKFPQERNWHGARLHDLIQTVNSITDEKFRIISSWFNKPSFASPSANINLLFKAVISEVKGLHANFNPHISIDGRDVSINGGQYFAIYDALYVLIFNAASYGKPNGKIDFFVRLVEPNKRLVLSVTSEVIDENALIIAKKEISARFESDLSDAHIVEGKSGIKKIRQLELDGYIKDVGYRYLSPDKIVSSFGFMLE